MESITNRDGKPDYQGPRIAELKEWDKNLPYRFSSYPQQMNPSTPLWVSTGEKERGQNFCPLLEYIPLGQEDSC